MLCTSRLLRKFYLHPRWPWNVFLRVYGALLKHWLWNTKITVAFKLCDVNKALEKWNSLRIFDTSANVNGVFVHPSPLAIGAGHSGPFSSLFLATILPPQLYPTGNRPLKRMQRWAKGDFSLQRILTLFRNEFSAGCTQDSQSDHAAHLQSAMCHYDGNGCTPSKADDWPRLCL